MSRIRSVAFDANGVLYYRDTDVVDSVIAAAHDGGMVLPDDAKARYETLMRQAFNGEITREQMVEAILDSWDLTAPAHRRAVAEAITSASRTIRLYPGVLETLARLRRLGIGTASSLIPFKVPSRNGSGSPSTTSLPTSNGSSPRPRSDWPSRTRPFIVYMSNNAGSSRRKWPSWGTTWMNSRARPGPA